MHMTPEFMREYENAQWIVATRTMNADEGLAKFYAQHLKNLKEFYEHCSVNGITLTDVTELSNSRLEKIRQMNEYIKVD